MLLNLGYQWTIAQSVENLQGVVFLPTGNTLERLRRNANPAGHSALLDPQLYLAGLDPTKCRTAVGRLATFPWFQAADVPAFDSGEINRSDWEQSIRDGVHDMWPGAAPEGDGIAAACESCIAVQLEIGCDYVLLPSPLIDEREDECQTAAEWLDAGLATVSRVDIGQPVLAALAISESVLNEAAFEAGGILDSLVDQVTAREGIDGVYLVVVQGQSAHPFESSYRVSRAYLHLASRFGQAPYDFVIVNFADLCGLVAMGVGATTFANGSSHARRRMCLQAFEDVGGGVALPHFYSHPAAWELLTEKDLDRIVAAKLLRRVRDETVFSEALMEALAAGRSAAELPEWAESKNKTTAAAKHFVARLTAEEATVRQLSVKKRFQHVRDWLEDAEANGAYLKEHLDGALKGRSAPVGRWREQLDGRAS